MYTPPPSDPIAYVDWLLAHMRDNLGHDMGAAHVLVFTLRTKDASSMSALARALRKAGYSTEEQESVDEYNVTTQKAPKPASGSARGRPESITTKSKGPPMVTALKRAKLSAAAIKRRVRAIIALAEKHNATYSSLVAMSMADFELLYGPPTAIPLGHACWRLRSLSDLGLRQGARMEFTFCLVAKDVKACMAALKKAGLSKVARAPKGADWTISVDRPGRNNEKRLKAAYAEMSRAAKAAGATLKGMDI